MIAPKGRGSADQLILLRGSKVASSCGRGSPQAVAPTPLLVLQLTMAGKRQASDPDSVIPSGLGGCHSYRSFRRRTTGRPGGLRLPSGWASGLERGLLGCVVENVQAFDVECQPHQVAHGNLEVRIDARDHIVATHRSVQELV